MCVDSCKITQPSINKIFTQIFYRYLFIFFLYTPLNLQTRIANLLGVAATDIPVKDIQKLMMPFVVIYNYCFIAWDKIIQTKNLKLCSRKKSEIFFFCLFLLLANVLCENLYSKIRLYFGDLLKPKHLQFLKVLLRFENMTSALVPFGFLFYFFITNLHFYLI